MSLLLHQKRAPLRVVLIAWMCVAASPELFAQAGSDYIAYPSGFVGDLGIYRSNPRQLTFNRMPGLSPDYRLGTGDEIELLIVGVGTQAHAVDSRGEITIPYCGPVHVGDLTAEEAESKIAQALRDKQLFREPQVLVSVTKYESKVVYALGELDRPGEYAVSFQMTLMDLIILAGGIDLTATRYGYLHRRAANAPSTWRPITAKAALDGLAKTPDVPREGTEVIQIDLQPLKRGGVLERNFVLRTGDVFYIPRRKLEFVYILGDVNKPGAFEIPAQQPATVAKAIAWAGGPLGTARVGRGIVIRQKDAVREELPVDFNAILNGTAPDVELQPNDIVFVPGSGAKKFVGNMLTTFRTMAAYLLVF